MKRSKVVERMAFFWLRLDDPNSEYAKSLSLETKMHHMLHMLEMAGMMPPPTQEGFFKKEVYKWEPEDETNSD